MPKPRLYHKRIDVLTTRQQWQAIAKYAKRYKLRWGEAVRDRLDAGLNHDSDVQEAYSTGYADGAGRGEAEK